jgi:DNA-binding NtrC family response regulator
MTCANLVAPNALAGLRVLVVEDEMLISLLIEDVLADQNCAVVGPFERVSAALEAARSASFDLAVLDVNVGGVKIYPVAEVLATRNIPFVLVSGYGLAAIPPEHPDWQVCNKPFDPEDLVAALLRQLHIR